MDDTANKSGHRKVGGGAPYWGAGGPKLPPPVSPRKSDKSPARAPRDSAQDTGGLSPLLGSSRVNQRPKPIKSPYASLVKPTQPRDRPNVNVHPPEGTRVGKSHRDAAVASLMTREKEKLAEEVVESRRLLRDMEEQLRVANTESLRLGAEVRKREKTIAALGEARDSGPNNSGGRAARVTELEAEVEVYLSEIARLSKVLAGVHLDESCSESLTRKKKVSFAAGTVPVAASGSSSAASEEVRALTEEVRALRAQLALGPRLSKFGGNESKRTGTAATLEDDLHDAEERIRSLDQTLEEREADARRLRAESERLSATGDELRREKEALQRDACKLREDREHFRRLAAMEAAAAAAAREEASVAKAEAARTKPAVSRLKQQLVTLVEQVDQMRAAGGASVRGGDADMDGASIIAPSSSTRLHLARCVARDAGSRRWLRKESEASEGMGSDAHGVPSRMSVESPGAINEANEGGGGREEDEDSDVDEADEYLIADALDKSEASSSGYSSYGADEHDTDDDETATRDDETQARSDSETTTSSKRYDSTL